MATRDRAVLVTGATGFIGSHLCEALNQANYEVHTLSRHPPAELNEEQERQKNHHHVCDLTKDLERLAEILKCRQWYAVCHVAGLVSYSGRDAAKLQAANVDATRTLVEQVCKRQESDSEQPIRFIYCSSVAAVGCNRTKEENPLTEDVEWDNELDSIAYMRSKKQAEDIVRNSARKGQIHATCVCPSNVYGARDALKGSRSTQVRAARGKARLYTHGGVSIVHISVVIQLFLSLLSTPLVPNEHCSVWNGSRWLVTGDNISIKDMLRMCAQAAGRDPSSVARFCLPTWLLWLVGFVGQFLGSKSMTVDRVRVATRYHWYDGERARRRFNLPHVSARDAIFDSVTWMRHNGLL